MGYIKVDYSKLKAKSDEIDNHINSQKQYIRSADSEINQLYIAWNGEDYIAFKTQWDAVNENGSMDAKTISALQKYAEMLRFAAKEYKNAQTTAVEKAMKLPTW